MSQNSRYVRCDVPPASSSVIELLRPKANFNSCLIICSPGFQGVRTHWAGRTVPHLGNDGEVCPWCLQKKRLEWKGYLHVCKVDGKGSAFLELTPDAANYLKPQFEGVDNWRGGVIHVKRKDAKLRATLLCELTSFADAELKLPAPRDVMPTLEKLWANAM